MNLCLTVTLRLPYDCPTISRLFQDRSHSRHFYIKISVMSPSEFASGQNSGWSFLHKLGEGDAGEVFLVESLVDGKKAILKRPRRSLFTTEVLRQSNQISQEGKVLRALSTVQIDYADTYLHFPALLDTSKPGSDYSERLFIVIEKAAGVDLAEIARAARYQASTRDENEQFRQIDQESLLLLKTAGKTGIFPRLILLRSLGSILELLERIHTLQIGSTFPESYGIIWNDVKPEHIFWDLKEKRFTIIDWGNAIPLVADGTSMDRNFSVVNDYGQYLDAFGQFLTEVQPDLYRQLEWPERSPLTSGFLEGIKPLKIRLDSLLENERAKLTKIRNQEDEILQNRNPSLQNWDILRNLQESILEFGDLPDWSGAERLAVHIGSTLVTEGARISFLALCEQAAQLPLVNKKNWEIVLSIGRLNPWPGLWQLPTQQALTAGLERDWASCLWLLRLSIEEMPPPQWWHDLCDKIRQVQPEIGPKNLTPLTVLRRIILTLQAQSLKQPAPQLSALLIGPEPQSLEEGEESHILVSRLKEQIVPRWIELEPDPPHSDLEYREIENELERIERLQPDARKNLENAIEQPRALVKIILDSWDRREFETARRGLRRLFLWDPDRLRVFTADQALARAPAWLDGIRQGPPADVSLIEFITRYEMKGREMRYQVGKARWLDSYTEAFSRLRKGSIPADILLDFPDLRSELPWLLHYHPPKLKTVTGPILLERQPKKEAPGWLINTTRSGEIGELGQLALGEPLDTWTPEAPGSSARVFQGRLLGKDGEQHLAAIKIMRPGLQDYALPLFREEAEVLTLLKDVAGVNTLLELGFIRLNNEHLIASDHNPASASNLTGSIQRVGLQDIHTFFGELKSQTNDGWLPYLALPKMDPKANLMNFCDAGRTHGRFLSLKESLRLIIQILRILQVAHSRNIIYRDHKILHFYWLEEENGVSVIDWNVARHEPGGLTPADRSSDLVQFGARALHHILTGRPAPGALPVGPTRSEEIDQAAKAYTPQWTFDDQRLPTRLKEVVERVLVGHYDQVQGLLPEIVNLFHELPEEEG
jgi:serine/threonine protein kinase